MDSDTVELAPFGVRTNPVVFGDNDHANVCWPFPELEVLAAMDAETGPTLATDVTEFALTPIDSADEYNVAETDEFTDPVPTSVPLDDTAAVIT
jgi:hypothetical protein